MTYQRLATLTSSRAFPAVIFVLGFVTAALGAYAYQTRRQNAVVVRQIEDRLHLIQEDLGVIRELLRQQED